jgi:hypothetical protein
VITFDSARRLAEKAWPESDYAGAFPTMEPFEAGAEGLEDRSGYLIESAKPALDPAGMPAMDVPVVLVSKETGDVSLETYIDVRDRVRYMTPVSATP